MKTMLSKFPGTCCAAMDQRRHEADSESANSMKTTTEPPTIDQVEMTEADIAFAERIAKRLGFTQTAYTSSSAIWGLFCLPDRPSQRHGVIVKTAQFGFMFLADLEDMQMHDLAEQARGLEVA